MAFAAIASSAANCASRLRPAAEAAAAQHRLDIHLLGLQPEDTGNGALIERLDLAAETRNSAILAELQITVERLHRRMSEIREDIFRLDHLAGFRQRCVRIAMLAGDRAGLARQGAILVEQLLRAALSRPCCRPT